MIRRDVRENVSSHLNGAYPVCAHPSQADVPGGDAKEAADSGLQVSIQRAYSDSESQSECSDLKTCAEFPTMHQ